MVSAPEGPATIDRTTKYRRVRHEFGSAIVGRDLRRLGKAAFLDEDQRSYPGRKSEQSLLRSLAERTVQFHALRAI